MEANLDRNILVGGSDECGRIARKLKRVSEAFDGRWAPRELPKGVSAKVEELTAEYERIEGVLAQCGEYLNGEWKRIENNRARLSEVEAFPVDGNYEDVFFAVNDGLFVGTEAAVLK